METYSEWDPKIIGWKGFIRKLYAHHKPDGGALLLRLGIGALFIAAGWLKVSHMDMTVGFFAQLGFGTFAAYFASWFELIGGMLIVLGILTKPTCVGFAIELAVIIFATPARPSALYFGHDYEGILFICFLALYLMGPGKYSLAHYLRIKNQPRA